MYFLASSAHRFLLGWSAKAGCSTLKRWYLDVHGVNWERSRKPVYKIIGYGNSKYRKVNWSRARDYAGYRNYAFVRNPYSRLISGFVNKYVDGDRIANHGWSTFNEFIDVLDSDKYLKKVDRHHFTPQFSEDYDSFRNAGFSLDKAFKMEDLNAGLTDIARKHSIAPVSITRSNQTEYRGPRRAVGDVSIEDLRLHGVPPFECFYDRDTLEIVSRIYSIDFSEMESLGLFYEAPRVDKVSGAD